LAPVARFTPELRAKAREWPPTLRFDAVQPSLDATKPVAADPSSQSIGRGSIAPDGLSSDNRPAAGFLAGLGNPARSVPAGPRCKADLMPGCREVAAGRLIYLDQISSNLAHADQY
jgi:hypothetical protein